MVGEIARNLGHDPGELNISRSSVTHQREKHRQQQRTDMHNAFKAEGKTCIVPWDSKLLQSLLCSTTFVDRLPALKTAVFTGETQLLGVPKRTSGTGKNNSQIVWGAKFSFCE